jgi:hybrid cluster-associated redox disulfide protein
MNRIWTPDPDMTMDTIMRTWPVAIAVLIRHRMLCIGCPIATFHTLSEACHAHGIDEGALVNDLGDAILPNE